MPSIPGTRRSTVHGMVSPSNTAYRVYNIHYVMTGTTTPANCRLYLVDAEGTITNTASAGATIYVTANYDASIPVGVGNWDCSEGVLLPNGLYIHTPSALVYYSVVYSTEPK